MEIKQLPGQVVSIDGRTAMVTVQIDGESGSFRVHASAYWSGIPVRDPQEGERVIALVSEEPNVKKVVGLRPAA